MQFHADVGELHGLVVRKPPPLPTEPPISPSPPPPSWTAAQSETDRALDACQSGGAHVVQCKLDALYKHWADTAEKELAGARQTTFPCWGSRGNMPQQRWFNILEQDRQAPPHWQPQLFPSDG
eukprot:4546566-Pyramimonas_sp.AAC.1